MKPYRKIKIGRCINSGLIRFYATVRGELIQRSELGKLKTAIDEALK
jgi:hypothetical protein